MESPYKNVADRFRLKAWRRPMNVPWARRRWMWGIGLAAVFAGLGVGWLARGERMWWSHPVSTSHHMIENNCAACHQDGFQHVQISWQGPDYLRGLESRTCQTCHENYATDDHHAGLMDAAAAGSCFSCHQEHQGKELLAWVDDAHCTNCHSDLHAADGQEFFAANITSFDDHPEFALRRPASEVELKPRLNDSGSATLDEWNCDHLAAELAEMDSASGRLADKARIRFSHAYHLRPEGVPVPHSHPRFEQHKAVQLECADCHQPDGDGRYLQPIRYERHCQSCHLLVISERFVKDDAVLPEDRYLPHEKPEVIRGILRERLLASLEANAPAEPPQHPTKPPVATARDKWQQVDEMLQALDATVVGAACGVMPLEQREHLDRVRRGHAPFIGVESGCAHCHYVSRPAKQIGQLPRPLEFEIEPPRIPDRWYPHSRFRHDKHDTLSCTACHYLDAGDPQSINMSAAARDILLPSIDTCRQCHGAEGRASGGGQARSACVECHTYHHPAPAAGRPLEKLLHDK